MPRRTMTPLRTRCAMNWRRCKSSILESSRLALRQAQGEALEKYALILGLSKDEG